MSRSVRADSRRGGAGSAAAAARDEMKRAMHALDRVRHWEKKWVTIGETTMKIFKWVPISSGDHKKKLQGSATGATNASNATKNDNKENAPLKKAADSSNSNFAEDSNTCFSTVGDSQGPVDFSTSHIAFSEDSNSHSNEAAPAPKRPKTSGAMDG